MVGAPLGRVLAWGDLALVAAAGLGVLARESLPQPVRAVAAVTLLVWGVGHLAFEAGWPRGAARVHGRIERQAFALGLSLTITPVVAVVLHLAGALNPGNLQTAIGAISVVLFVLAVMRRLRAPRMDPPDADATANVPLTRRERSLTVAAAALGLATILVVGFQIASLAEPAPTTLRVTDLDGGLPRHPHNVTLGAEGAVLAHLGGGASQSYRLQASLPGSPTFETVVEPIAPGREATIRIPIPARAEPGTAWLTIEAVGATTGETRTLRLLLQFQDGTP